MFPGIYEGNIYLDLLLDSMKDILIVAFTFSLVSNSRDFGTHLNQLMKDAIHFV